MRVKSEASKSSAIIASTNKLSSTEQTDAASPNAASPSGATVQPSVRQSDANRVKPKVKEATPKNLVGRLTNLVTTDLNTLQGGQSFMSLCMFLFVQYRDTV